VTVADRGMISAATMAGPEAQGIDYILGVRERSTAEVRSTVIDDDGVVVPLTIPRQKGETDLAIKDVVLSGRRYGLARNPNRLPRTPRRVPPCWPTSNASRRRAIRRWSATPCIAASWMIRRRGVHHRFCESRG
jgi:hypothetical protein